ncbi:MAG: hypothetical protein OWR52_14025 [Acidibacillus sp.]|nr:hypothetical protein [Acidibacillus sp.]
MPGHDAHFNDAAGLPADGTRGEWEAYLRNKKDFNDAAGLPADGTLLNLTTYLSILLLQ